MVKKDALLFIGLLFVGLLPVARADAAVEDVDAATVYSFMSIGDWGGAALEDYHKDDQYAVAKAMAATATALSAKLVIGAGDNYY
jgi:hypothetical protein